MESILVMKVTDVDDDGLWYLFYEVIWEDSSMSTALMKLSWSMGSC